MGETDETVDDYFGRLNIEGKKTTWVENRAKINYVYRMAKKHIRRVRAARACEVGSGEGYPLRLLRKDGLDVSGIDISKYLVNELDEEFEREGLGIELIHGDISNVKLEEDRFDLLFCLDVLEHILNVEEAVKNIKRVLVNNGLLICTLPLRENLYAHTVMCPKCNYKFHRRGHYHSFETPKEIEQLLGHQFTILEIGEVKIFNNVSDIITYALMKITRLILRKDIESTVYFIVRLAKD